MDKPGSTLIEINSPQPLAASVEFRIQNAESLFYLSDANKPDQTNACRNMSRRFFAPDAVPSRDFLMTGDQAHHLANVMRFQPGEQIVLFDGKGHEFPATILETSKKQVRLKVGPANATESVPNIKLSVAVSLPKGDRQKFLVEKLVELGAARLIPLKTDRSVAAASPKVVARIKSQIVEASKQCGRNLLMHVESEQTFAELNKLVAQSPRVQLLIATPGADAILANLDPGPVEEIVIAIGPEGGFTPEEQSMAIASGWSEVSLGANILRIETAAIAATVLVQAKQVSKKTG